MTGRCYNYTVQSQSTEAAGDEQGCQTLGESIQSRSPVSIEAPASDHGTVLRQNPPVCLGNVKSQTDKEKSGMKYQGIRKIHEGKFITRYDVDYVTAEGRPKTYEIISRNRNIQTLDDLQNKTPNAVVMILTDARGERILVNREYRMAMAQWIYYFPAGLIDPGETPEESAKRELWEETGLRLVRIDGILDNSYSAVGFSNERNVCVFGVADGEFHKSTSDAEEIVPGWYTKEEIMKLLHTEPFAARTQAYCFAWANH